MKIGSLSLPNVKPKYSWVLPLIALFFWWGMLIAMMIVWFAKGRPILDTDHYYMTQFIVYLSNIGATNLQPLFIVGGGGMGIFFVWSVIEDYHLRTKEKSYLPPVFHWIITAIHALAIAMCIIGCLCILLVTCLKDNWEFSREHGVFVVLFVIFVFVYLCFHILAFFLYYKKYQIRYFLISAIMKLVWIAIAIVFVVCYGAYMGKGNSDGNHSINWGYSAIMEWTLVYFYGTLFFIIAWDLRQASYGNPNDWMIDSDTKPEYDDSEEHDTDWDPIDNYANLNQNSYPPKPEQSFQYNNMTENSLNNATYAQQQYKYHSNQSRDVL